MAKKWIVTAVDTSETCDGKARVLKACNSPEEALSYAKADMEEWIARYKEEGIEYDFTCLSATFDYNSGNGCQWNVEEVEVPEEELSPYIKKTLNAMAAEIISGKEEYFCVESGLNEKEDAYLRSILYKNGMLVIKEDGVTLTGGLMKSYVAEHGEPTFK